MREAAQMFLYGFSQTPVAFQIFFILMFAAVIGIFTYAIVHGTKTWVKNNNSPFETVDAQIVAKRQHVSGSHSSASTWYYITFQLSNGERIELPVKGEEYGMLAEGDRGKLSHQGTRYKGFERIIS